ncbi:hypothetical protein Tco_1448369 [Tanacetum coccineum]
MSCLGSTIWHPSIPELKRSIRKFIFDSSRMISLPLEWRRVGEVVSTIGSAIIVKLPQNRLESRSFQPSQNDLRLCRWEWRLKRSRAKLSISPSMGKHSSNSGKSSHGEHPRSSARSGDFEKISRISKLKGRPFSRFLLVNPRWIWVTSILVLGVTTGSSTWTNRSLDHSSQNQFLTHPKLDELELAIPTVLVLVPTILIVGLAVVLHGRKTGWVRILFAIGGGRKPEFSLVEFVAVACETSFLGSTSGGYTGGGSAPYYTLATMALLSGLTNFDLLSKML